MNRTVSDDRAHDTVGPGLAPSQAKGRDCTRRGANCGQSRRHMENRNQARRSSRSRQRSVCSCPQLYERQGHQPFHRRKYPWRLDQGSGASGKDGQRALCRGAEDTARSDVPAALTDGPRCSCLSQCTQLSQWRGDWETKNLIPTEFYPEVTSDHRPRSYGMPKWADMFSPRQLLGFGVLMEELQGLKPEVLPRRERRR